VQESCFAQWISVANVKKVGINYRPCNRIIAGLKNATLKKT
jgi:hypothetical protein